MAASVDNPAAPQPQGIHINAPAPPEGGPPPTQPEAPSAPPQMLSAPPPPDNSQWSSLGPLASHPANQNQDDSQWSSLGPLAQMGQPQAPAGAPQQPAAPAAQGQPQGPSPDTEQLLSLFSNMPKGMELPPKYYDAVKTIAENPPWAIKMLHSVGKGVADLMNPESYMVMSDNPNSGQLSPDALQTLALLSPGLVGHAAEAAKAGDMGIDASKLNPASVAENIKPEGMDTPAPNTSSIDEQTKAAFPGVIKDAKQDITGDTKAIYPKSAGEMTQDQKLQQFEEDAAQGHMGEGAKTQASALETNRARTVEKQISGLGGARPNGNPTDSLNEVANVIRDQEKSAGEGVNSNYELAKSTSRDAGVTPEHMEDAMPAEAKNGDVVFENKDGSNFEISKTATPIAYKKYQDFKNILKPEDEEADTSNLLPDLENWRKTVTSLASKAPNASEAAGLRALRNAYDSHMSSLADNMEDGAGSEAIQNFKNAVQSRRDYGARFEGNKNVENMINPDSNIDDISRQVIGSGSIKGKNGLKDTYDATIRAAGDKSDVVNQKWKDALAQNLYNKVQNGKLPNSQEPAFSTKSLEAELRNLFVNQKELATSVYGPETVAQSRQALAELKTINSAQKGVKNPSGSGNTAVRLSMQALKAKIPLLEKVLDKGMSVLTDVKNEGIAKQAFSGKTPKGFNGSD